MGNDDWEYTRTRQQHFTEAEMALIRQAFENGRLAKDLARELRCSSRVIFTHFANLRRKNPMRKREPRLPRFYRSNFQPS